MNAERCDDLALAREVAAGDERALQTFYERFADPLFAFILHHLDGSRPDAEDVWQDTLLAVVRSLPAYQGQSRLFTWMCGIAHHKIADHCRRRGYRTEPFSLIDPEDIARIMDTSPLPEELVAQKGTRAQVVSALERLPSDYRLALVARYADEQGVEDVARLLGRSYKATESLLARARQAFQAAFTTMAE